MNIESKNLSLIAPDDISLNKTLKELKLNLTTLLDYMKKISSNGQGDSWQTYLRSLFKTEYIENDFSNGIKGIRELPIEAKFGVFMAYRYYSQLLKKLKKNGECLSHFN